MKKAEQLIRFGLQRYIFFKLKYDAYSKIRNILNEESDRILALANVRHTEGFIRFGSEMYGWSAEERLQNILEELADAVVYATSGPISKGEEHS